MMRLLCTCVAFMLAVSPAWATYILDDFNRADGALGGNWTDVTPAQMFTIVGNQVEMPTAGGVGLQAYTGLGTPANTYAEATIRTLTDNAVYAVVLAGMSTDAEPNHDGYIVQTDGTADAGDTAIYKVTDGSVVLVLDLATTFSVGDVLGVSRVVRPSGSVRLSVWRNRQFVNAMTDNTSPFTGGYPGIGCATLSTGVCQMDNFQAFSLTVPTKGFTLGFGR